MLCGDIVKVTPSSKVVGDLAQFMVSNKLDAAGVEAKADTLSFPTSVVEYFQGIIGQPPGGFPEPLRSKIVKSLPKIEGRPGATMSPLDFAALRVKLEKEHGPAEGTQDPSDPITETDVLTAALYPNVFKDHCKFVKENGDVSILPTPYFLAPLDIGEELALDIELGKTLYIKLLATGPTDPTTGKREVYFSLNGQTRAVTVVDSKNTTTVVARPKADVTQPGEVGCPMSGVVLEVRAKQGSNVKVGDPICVLSAMKMETVVSAPVAGRVDELLVKPGDSLQQGDLIVRLVAESWKKEDGVLNLARTPDN
jgi:pyruvate carboxylase